MAMGWEGSPESRQEVRAEGGYSYGAIGADIHVFGDGVPVYLLINWSSAVSADPVWLRQLPSRMLSVRHQVVAFTGRSNELSELRRWREITTRLAVRWLYGQGGQGKSRLATEFAADTAYSGWKVVKAIHGPGTVLPPPGSQDLQLEGFAGLLLVVDYADRWPLAHLTWLFSNALIHRSGIPTRILLLARGMDGWPAVRHSLSDFEADTDSQHLEPLSDSTDERPTMFRAARDGFAGVYGIDFPERIRLPDSLEQREMGLTLALHIAALAAVDAFAEGERPPSGIADLTIYLLDRERLHWANLYGDVTHRLEPGHGFATTPDVMNRAVFAATLVGAVDYQSGLMIINHLNLGVDAERTVSDHAVCYPPLDTSGATALEPLYPDRLAEDFLALTIPGHSSDYPRYAWAPETVSILLEDEGERPVPAYSLPRAITFLAVAAQRWPNVGDECLQPLLRKYPRLALEGGNAALAALAEITNFDIRVLEQIEALFPGQPHGALAPGIVAVTQRLTDYCLTQTSDQGEHAKRQVKLALRLSYAGRSDEAVTVCRNAVDKYRQLLLIQPDSEEVLEGLSASLGNLANFCSQTDRISESLEAGNEALKLSFQLADANPAFLPVVATEAANSANRILDAGWKADAALENVTFALNICRRLHNHQALLASTLLIFGTVLTEMKRHREAWESMSEAVAIRRDIARSDPAAHEVQLGEALYSSGITLMNLERNEHAVIAFDESIEILRRYAHSNPQAIEPQLARALSTVGGIQETLGQYKLSASTCIEAVGLYRRHPYPSLDLELARVLHTAAVSLARLGRNQQALPFVSDAIEIQRKRLTMSDLASRVPRPQEITARQEKLATSLNTLSVLAAALGRHDMAIQATTESIDIYRNLAEPKVTVYRSAVAMGLHNLRLWLYDSGQFEAALDAAMQCVGSYRQLAQDDAAQYLPHLFRALHDLAETLGRLQRYEEALAAEVEMVNIQRGLANATPHAFEPDLAAALNNLAVTFFELERREDGLASLLESIEIRRRLSHGDLIKHGSGLAITLCAASQTMAELGQKDRANAAIIEAVNIFRFLASVDAERYSTGLNTALSILRSQGTDD